MQVAAFLGVWLFSSNYWLETRWRGWFKIAEIAHCHLLCFRFLKIFFKTDRFPIKMNFFSNFYTIFSKFMKGLTDWGVILYPNGYKSVSSRSLTLKWVFGSSPKWKIAWVEQKIYKRKKRRRFGQIEFSAWNQLFWLENYTKNSVLHYYVFNNHKIWISLKPFMKDYYSHFYYHSDSIYSYLYDLYYFDQVSQKGYFCF